MGTCTNCGNPLKEPHVFQGVVICVPCFRLVSAAVARAKKEVEMVYLTYTDMLRVALVRGELRPPVLPTGTDMPPDVFKEAMTKVGGRLAQSQRSPSGGNGYVPKLRLQPKDQDRQAPGG